MSISKISLRLGLFLAAAVVMAVAGMLFSRLQNPDNPAEQLQAPNVRQPAKTPPVVSVPGLPIRLRIPKIDVNAAVESLGLTASGDLDAPKNTNNVGWYNAGHRPGSAGTAVLDGHFGWADGKAAVFDKLHTLQQGDLLHVDDGNSSTHTFVVTEMQSLKPDEDASAVFSSKDNKARLNLITCEGAWDKHKQSYSARLIVFADLLAD